MLIVKAIDRGKWKEVRNVFWLQIYGPCVEHDLAACQRRQNVTGRTPRPPNLQPKPMSAASATIIRDVKQAFGLLYSHADYSAIERRIKETKP